MYPDRWFSAARYDALASASLGLLGQGAHVDGVASVICVGSNRLTGDSAATPPAHASRGAHPFWRLRNAPSKAHRAREAAPAPPGGNAATGGGRRCTYIEMSAASLRAAPNRPAPHFNTVRQGGHAVAFEGQAIAGPLSLHDDYPKGGPSSYRESTRLPSCGGRNRYGPRRATQA